MAIPDASNVRCGSPQLDPDGMAAQVSGSVRGSDPAQLTTEPIKGCCTLTLRRLQRMPPADVRRRTRNRHTIGRKMRLTNLGIDKDLSTVVVLGAGASRGSSCARPTGVAPPLDADFFAQAQRMSSGSLTRDDRDLFNFVREEFGQGNIPTLEVFFTQITAVDRFHHEFNIRGRPSGKFGRHLGTLRRLIPRVFGEALGGQTCLWHCRIASALRAGDAILSFNYDTLIDRALKDAAGKRWNPDVGYGFKVSHGSELWSPPPSPGPHVRNPIRLLKPHGSLNWRVDEAADTVALVEEYTPETADSIVPPTWDKSIVSNRPWNDVWRSAREVLGLARLLIVVGYSVPVTDQLSQALLRADVNSLNGLIIVNPDPESRRRMINVMSSAIDPNTLVIELSTLNEFASYLPRSEAEPPEVHLETELERVHNEIRGLARRVRDFRTAHGERELREELDDLRGSFEELEGRVDEIEESGLAGDIQRVQDEVRDLDARIDSIVG